MAATTLKHDRTYLARGRSNSGSHYMVDNLRAIEAMETMRNALDSLSEGGMESQRRKRE